ncbi:SGNH/GDSL hydrolase family protein [Mycoplasmopsis felis]|uniref:SGNH/GDSL hydrolase family protein n=1 Tax=Mycoplasmopsis felis TaxID=33923 RepID=UPI003A4DAED5
MKKKTVIFSSTIALLAAISMTVSCQAPGSSKPIQGGGQKFLEEIQRDDSDNQLIELNTTFVQKPSDNSNKLNSDIFIQINPTKTKSYRLSSDKLIKKFDKIRYVALGDSITEGFDGTLTQSYPGKRESDGSISGVSYPAYLARLLNFNNRVESFNNYGISGSRILDWIKFLGIEYNDSTVSNYDLTKIFGANWQSKSKEIKKELSQANLITFTLSANDLFFLFFQSAAQQDVAKLIKTVLEDGAVIGDALVFVDKLFKNSLREMKKRLITFVSNLKLLAPKANINLVGYPTPMLGFANVISEYISSLLGINIEISPVQLLTDLINKGLKEISEITQINFINPVNVNYWNKNTEKVSTLFFDIHPNSYGYKKMAMDLYLKIANPSLDIEDFKNYDFNQEFIDYDKESLKYQIEVNIEDSALFGINTLSYLENKTEQEHNVDIERNIHNFGQRIAELTKTFQYITREIFNYLTDNVIYNEIDPDHLLKNILHKEITQNKFGMDTIVDSIINSNGIQNILFNIENQLVLLRENNELTLPNVLQTFTKSLFNEQNLAIIFSSISKSEVFVQNKTEISNALKVILNNVIKIYGLNINNTISNILIEKVQKYNINKDELQNIIQSIITSKHTKEIINSLVDAFALYPENFSNVQSFNDIIHSLFKQPQINELLAKNINNLIKELLTNTKVKDIAVDFLFDILTKENLANNISREQIDLVISDLIKLFDTINTDFSLINRITHEVLNNFSAYGIDNITSLFIDSIEIVFRRDFSNVKDELLLDLLQTIIGSDFFNNHKDSIKQLLRNILVQENLEKISNITSKLLENTKLVKYISQEGLQKFIVIVFSQPQILEILNFGLDSLIDNSQELLKARTLDDLLNEIIKHLNLENIQVLLVPFVNNILNNAEFPNVIKDILTTLLSNFNFDLENELNIQFINDFSNNVISLINEYNIIEPIINQITNQIKIARTSADPTSEIKKIPSLLLEILKNKFTENIIPNIKNLLNKDWVQNNPHGISNLASVVFVQLKDTGILNQVINDILNIELEKETIIKYIDKDEVLGLIDSLINTQGIAELIQKLIFTGLTNSDWIDNVNNINQFLNYLLNNNSFKEVIVNNLKPILKQLVLEGKYQKTIVKTIKVLLNDNGYVVNNKYDEVFLNIVPSILNTLTTTNKFDNLLDTLFNVIQKATNLSDIQNNLPNDLLISINLKDLNLYTNLLKTPLFSENKELAKELFRNLYDTFKNDHLQKVLNLILPNQILGISKVDLSNLILKISKNTNFISFINNLFGFIVDNSSNIGNSENFIQIINIFFKNTEFINQNKSLLTNILNELKSNNTFVEFISNFLKEQLSSSELNWIFTNTTNANGLIKEILTFSLAQIDHFHLFEHLFNSLSEYSLSSEQNYHSIITNFLNNLKTEFTGDNLKNNIVHIIKSLPENFINTHRNDIKQVLVNVYDHLKQRPNLGQTILNFLPVNLKQEVNKYVSEEVLNNILFNILNKEQTQTLFINTIDNLLNINNLNQLNSFDDLIKALLRNINGQELKSNLIAWLDEIVNDTKLLSNLTSVISNVIKFNFNNLYNNPQTDEFLKLFIPEVYSWIKEFNLLEIVFEEIVLLLNINNKEDLNTKVNTFKNNLITKLKDKIVENWHPLVKKIYESNFFNEQKEYTKFLLNGIFEILVDNFVIFKDVLNNLLIENQFIDSNNKLTEDQINLLKPLLKSINNIDTNVSIIDKLIEIDKSLISQTNNSSELISLLTNKLIEFINIKDFKLVKILLGSDFIRSNKSLFKHIFEQLLSNHFNKTNIDKLINLIPLDTLGSNLGIRTNDLTYFISQILLSDNSKNIIKTIVNSSIDNIERLSQSNSFNELFINIFNINNLKDNIKNYFVSLIKNTLTDNNVQDKLREFIINLFNKEILVPYLANVSDKNTLAQNIVNIYQIIDNRLNISELIFEIVYSQLSNNGIDFNVSNFINAFINGFKQKLGTEQEQEQNLINLIKDILKSNLFSQNKSDLVQIVVNIINKLADGTLVDNLIDNLSDDLKNNIHRFISIDSLKVVSKGIFKNQHFINIIKGTVQKIIEHSNEFEDIDSYSSLIKKILSIISLDEVKQDLTSLITHIVSDNEIKNGFVNFLRTTLSINGVNIKNTNISNFINGFVENLNSILNDLQIIKPTIDSIFNSLIEISNTQDSNVVDQFLTIPNKLIEIIQDIVFKNPKTYLDRILNNTFISTNKEIFIKIVSDILIHNKNVGSFDTLIKNLINKLDNNQEIFRFIDKNNLRNIALFLLKDNITTEFIEQVFPGLIRNTDWLNNLDNPFLLVKNLLNNPNIENYFKNSLTKSLERIFGQRELSVILSSVIDFVLSKFNIDLTGINKINLVNNIFSSVIPFLKDINVFNPFVNTLIDSLKTTNSFEEFSSKLLIEIPKLFNFNFTTVKSFLNNFSTIKNSKDTIIQIINRIYTIITTNDNVFNKLFNLINIDSLLEPYNITKTQVLHLIKIILKNNNFRIHLSDVINNLLTRIDMIKESSDYNDLIKKILNDQNLKNTLNTIFQNTLQDLYNEYDFKDVIAKVVIKKIEDTKFSDIFQGISNKEQIGRTLVDILRITDRHISISNNLITSLINEVATSGLELNLNNLLATITQDLNTFFNSSNFEQTAINLLKEIATSSSIQNNKIDFYKLVENILDFVIQKTDLGSIIWNILSSDIQGFITKNLINKEEFAGVINKALKVDSLKNLVSNIIKYFIENHNQFSNSHSFIDIVKQYLSIQNNETEFKNSIKKVILDGLSSTETSNSIKVIINKATRFLNITTNNEINTFIHNFSSGVGQLLDRTGILEQLTNGLVKTFKESNNLNEIQTNFFNNITSSIELTNITFITKITNDDLIQNNKTGVKDLLRNLITNLLDNEQKIREVITEINIAKLLLNNTALSSLVNDTIILALRNQDIRDVINIIFSDFIDRASSYRNNQNWFGAIKTLLNSPRSNDLKTKLTGWIRTLFKNPDPRFMKGAATFLIDKLRNSGYNLSQTNDLQLFENVIRNFFKALERRPELYKIIDKIYENIKSINFANGVENTKDFKKAILNGALHLILTNDYTNISFSYLLDQKDLIKELINSLGDDNYVQLIHRLFESSNRHNMSGIYKIVNNFLVKTDSNSNSNSNSNQTDSYGFSFDENIFKVIPKTRDFLSVLFQPIFRNMIRKSSNRTYNHNQPKENPEYKAMYRLSTFILWFIYENGGDGGKFWNVFGLDVQGTFMSGLESAFHGAKSELTNMYNGLSNQHKVNIGAYSTRYPNDYNKEFILGNRSGSTTASNYWADQLLAYIYYRKDGRNYRRDRYQRNKNFNDVLLDSFERGYLTR